MIWGVSFALHEQAVMDPRSGRPMNVNLAEYHIPVNADVPSLEAILIEEHGAYVNALGIKGVGEIGIPGTAGAVAKRRVACNATGPPRRVMNPTPSHELPSDVAHNLAHYWTMRALLHRSEIFRLMSVQGHSRRGQPRPSVHALPLLPQKLT
jgi:hypothetical protein